MPLPGTGRIEHPLLLVPDWAAPATVRACVTQRRGGGAGISQPPFDAFNLGDRCGDAAEAVAHNRAALQRIAGLPTSPCWLSQVHGIAVQRFERPDDSRPEADAAVTAVPGVVLAVLTADCLPLLLCADDGSEVAAVHAGWRGLAQGVIEATLGAMGTAPSRLLAWLGPAAGAQAYEVGSEVRDAFVVRDSQAASAFSPTRPGHWLADLALLARLRLRAAGVARVAGGGDCTISQPERFFSHRRDGRGGRMASLVWIEPESIEPEWIEPAQPPEPAA